MKLITLLSLFVLTVAAHGGPLYPVEIGDRWGFVDKTGKLVVNPQFERAGAFSAGLAEVRLERWGDVDTAGKYVWNPTN